METFETAISLNFIAREGWNFPEPVEEEEYRFGFYALVECPSKGGLIENIINKRFPIWEEEERKAIIGGFFALFELELKFLPNKFYC